MNSDKARPLIVIVGPTASGKSALALSLARRFGGEIICADSRTVYVQMDIGTAKPSLAERALVRHHMLDVVLPNQIFTAADFKRLALQSIEEISDAGKLPILVGGSGLYIDSVLFDFAFRGPANTALRREAEGMSVDELQRLLRVRKIALPSDPRNPRHLVRALETGGNQERRSQPRPDTFVVGLHVDADHLAPRIADRVDGMFGIGLEGEVRQLWGQYGWDAPGMQSIGYREWKEYFEGSSTLSEVRERICIATRQYAKRQRTWFKRNPRIQWFTNFGEGVDSVSAYLNKIA